MTIDPTKLIMMFHLLIALPIAIIILSLLTFAIITLIKWLRWRASVRLAAAQAHAEAHGPDGTPYPPSCRGLCDHCSKYSHRIFHIPDGPKLCMGCYEKHIEQEQVQILSTSNPQEA